MRVPLGKLNTEHVVPLDAITLAAFDEWFAHRRHHERSRTPTTGDPPTSCSSKPAGASGPDACNKDSATPDGTPGLIAPGGRPLKIVAHQLRHTYATTLVNAGMSLQALMTLLGHSSPEMTMRYAQLASPTLRVAYDQAIGKSAAASRSPPSSAATPFPTTSNGCGPDAQDPRRPRLLLPGPRGRACPYANICETCSNFTTTPEFIPAITAQLDDIRSLRSDAEQRGWTSETARHTRVISSLEQHLQRLERTPSPADP